MQELVELIEALTLHFHAQLDIACFNIAVHRAAQGESRTDCRHR